MNAVDEFSQLISGIYSAVLAPDQWDRAVAAIAWAFDASASSLVYSDNGSRTLKHTQMPAAAAQSYAAYYQRLDHVFSAVEAGPLGAVRTGAELMWPYQHCEFQIDWARPNGLHDGLFVRLTRGPTVISLGIANVQRSDRFDSPEHVALATRLTPHLQQALRMQGHLDDLGHRSDDLTEASEAVNHGIVITDRRRVVYANGAAERILATYDGLRIDDGLLRADSSSADAQLEHSLSRASALDSVDVWGGSFLCARPSGRRPYVIHVLPTEPDSAVAHRNDRVMVVIIDPEGQPEPPATLLRRLYGLTNSEAQVAVLVMRGEGLAPIAEELSVSLTTVKTHLAHVFDKTGMHRQAELVRLLSMLDPLHR